MTEFANAGYDEMIEISSMACAFTDKATGKSVITVGENGTLLIGQEVVINSFSSSALRDAIKAKAPSAFSGNNLTGSIVLKTITIGGNAYPVTRAYNLEEMMIEAWNKTAVFTLQYGTVTMNLTITGNNFTVVTV
jgi:hypothetical protein